MVEIKVTPEEVKKIAGLSKMDVSGQEELFAELFTDTLVKIQDLKEVDTTKVEETFQVTGLVNVFQDEELQSDSLTKEECLSNAKENINGLFSTAGVFYKGENVS